MKTNRTINDYLMNAERVMFICPEENNGIPAVFVIFEDLNIAVSLYSEVARVNETNPQFLGFKKSHSSIILSFILEKKNSSHAKMLLDYNEKEFDTFISKVNSIQPYIILFGKIENDDRIIGFNERSIITCSQYLIQ